MHKKKKEQMTEKGHHNRLYKFIYLNLQLFHQSIYLCRWYGFTFLKYIIDVVFSLSLVTFSSFSCILSVYILSNKRKDWSITLVAIPYIPHQTWNTAVIKTTRSGLSGSDNIAEGFRQKSSRQMFSQRLLHWRVCFYFLTLLVLLIFKSIHFRFYSFKDSLINYVALFNK